MTQSASKGVFNVNFEQIPKEYNITVIHRDFIFEPLLLTVTEETTSIPEIKPVATYVCGKIFTLNYEKDQYEVSTVNRTVICLQEPNPLEGETWETPDIEKSLVRERKTTVDETGEFCFTASVGLWRINVQRTKEDKAEGINFDYSSERGSLAFVTNEAITNLNIFQTNSTQSGEAVCFYKEDCAGLEIKMQ